MRRKSFTAGWTTHSWVWAPTDGSGETQDGRGAHTGPVAKRPTALVLSAVLAVVAAVLLLLLVLRLSQVRGARSTLGDDVYKVRNASRYATEIRTGGPLLFQDLTLSRHRRKDIYLQHLGSDTTTGWLAFEAHLRGEPGCLVVLDRATRGLRDCHGDTVPADGGALVHYPATIQANTVVVDLRKPR